MTMLQIALNPQCKDKESPDSIASGWHNVECDLDYLLEWAAIKGRCWAATHFADRYRSAANARGSNVIAVDIDGDCSLDAFWNTEIARTYCLATYTSASHSPAQHRFRAIFRTELPLESSKEHSATYNVLALKLCAELNLPRLKDNSGAKPERAWFGNSKAQIERGHLQTALPAHWSITSLEESSAERGPLEEANDLEIKQCQWLLSHALRPSEDGEYEYWSRITAACSSTGDQLFDAWQAWCQRGHHGSESRQAAANCSASKYNSFNRGHWLALFKEAKEQLGQGWKQKLPGELQEKRPPLDPLPADLSEYEVAPIASEPEPALTQREVSASESTLAKPSEQDMEWLDDEMRANCGQRASAQTSQFEVAAISKLLPNLRRNTLTDRIEFDQLGSGETMIVEGNYLSTLSSHWSVEHNLYIPKERINDHSEYLATRNRYCPIKRYLHSIQHEPDYPRWDNLGSDLLNIPGPMATQVLQRFLIGSIARAYNPGCAMDWMPVLVGEQGAGKSQFAARLAPPHLFKEMPSSLKQLQAEPYRLHVAWVLELPEVDAHFKSNMREEFKNIVSTRTDTTRRAYDRHPTDLARKFTFIGTTNTKQFLNDPTGNRRFIPLQLPEGQDVPWRKIPEIRDQLWATALREYHKGTQYIYHSGDIKKFSEYMGQFQEEDAWLEQISQYVMDFNEVSINEILVHLGIDPKNQTQMHTKRASAILNELGWANNGKRRMIGKSKIRVWEAPIDLNPPAEIEEEPEIF